MIKQTKLTLLLKVIHPVNNFFASPVNIKNITIMKEKQTIRLLSLALCCCITANTEAQIFARGTVNSSSAVPSTNEQLRVTNGLITQYVSGTVGLGGTNDKWIGIGDPFQTVTPPNPSNLLYGNRIQWNEKALIMNLKGTTVSGSGVPTEAEFQWGGPDAANWGGSLNFNYINNFTSNTPQYRVLELTKTGNTIARTNLLGHSKAGTFGGLSTGDQWIGIGQPTNDGLPTGTLLPFYGTRAQWSDQSLITAVSDNAGTKKPIIQWGSQNQPLEFRYFTNPSNPSSSSRILELNTDGKVRVGPTFLILNSFPSPEQLQVYSNSGQGNLLLRSEFGTNPMNAFMIASGNGSSGQSNCILAQASFAQTCIGIKGTGYAANSVNYGVWGEGAPTNAVPTYGVYGSITTTGGANNWAGYFAGRVFGNQFLTSSDQQLKTNVKNEDESVLNRLKQLRPVNYNYKANDKSYEKMGLPDGLRHGFIAQEVEKVFPELVTNIKQPVNVSTDPERKNDPVQFIEFKGVDYLGMVSLLTKAIQEQSAKIELLEQKINQQQQADVLMVTGVQKADAERISKQAYMLAQNQPNPFTATTVIRYAVPENSTNAMIGVFDLNGKMLLQYKLQPGSSQVTINGSSLSAGMYLYSLLVNGEELVTRKMVLTK